MAPQRRFLKQIPLVIAVGYAIFGTLWIVFSDRFWATLDKLPFPELVQLQTTKGLIFITITTLMFWAMVRWAMSRVAEAEEARGASEARYRQIFERSTTVNLVLDIASMRMVDANPAAVRFYGWPREELIGKPLADVTAQPESAVRDMVEAAEGERRNSFVSRHRLRSGVVRDVEIHSSPFELAGRRVLFSIVHDITDRLRAERQLTESEANYRRALEQASDAIVVSDRQGVILEVNARTEEILGLAREEIEGRRLEDFLPEEDRERMPLRLRDLLDGGSLLAERRLQRRNGTLADVEISARDLGDGRFQAIVRDIGERRRLEEQLRQAQKMEAVGQLTGGIAHDLNNLLTVVLANSEMILAALPPGREDLKGDLSELQAAARRGAHMIRKLLSFSRHAPLTYQVLDLGRVVEDLLGTLRRLLPAHIEVEFSREADVIKVLADSGAIEQVVLNLTTNARDAMPRGGTLHLEARRIEVARPPDGALPGSYGCLVVRDTGVGMDERVRARAFEPFFTTKPPGEGSGLGMAMIYGLTQQHGGFLELESAVGKGTTVRMYVPLARDDQPLTEMGASMSVLPGGRERILLVEDEDGLRKVAQRALERVGYKVITASDGVEALNAYRKAPNSVDLIITDVVMPKLGGVGLYRALRQEGHWVRFLFTSGYAAHEIVRGDLPETDLLLLQKPWTLADLTQRVREVLDRKY